VPTHSPDQYLHVNYDNTVVKQVGNV